MVYFIDFILLGIVYVFLIRKWKKVKNGKSVALFSIMYFYMVLVLYVTVMPFTIPFSGTNDWFMETANFMPFRDLRLKYDGAFREIYLNILMMFPFGLLFPLIKQKGFVKTVFATFLFSFFIESYQLLSVWWNGVQMRIFDVTDLITNTLGGALGYIAYKIFRAMVRK
ncbi:hypothetical protein CD30_13435 [Ureibacillus massiliensis 4400831 = CIP 108448 = CCUG 49529]|uniref:VanZ-like domain-containing protein n=1 Tax=Ureibacillus massiliensis 4400831 = CIP 108448 = CCUG 49529 TaxID=1211035 RepID=A0A0A3IZK0_9BACL|nr:VanZ family protein [Ureibacillus massiliensis]KGR90146.1 hypothetical protein CD30_13435 [Ureibacillus massiliensis 4400831 = CIP 108448 = CCUG 49529]